MGGTPIWGQINGRRFETNSSIVVPSAFYPASAGRVKCLKIRFWSCMVC